MKIITFRANEKDLKTIEFIKKHGFPEGFKATTADAIKISITYQALEIGYKQQKDSSSIE